MKRAHLLVVALICVGCSSKDGGGPVVGAQPLVAEDIAGMMVENRPEKSLAEFLIQMKQEGKLDLAAKSIVDFVSHQMGAPENSEILKNLKSAVELLVQASPEETVEKLLEKLTTLERPFVLTLENLKQVQDPLAGGVLGHSSSRLAGAAPVKYTGEELFSVIGRQGEDCAIDRGMPKPVSNDLPEVLWGHYPDPRLSDCSFKQSVKLAEVLTALARGDSKITYKEKEVTSSRALLSELFASGHKVTYADESTYANFISVTYAGTKDNYNVRIPVWIDTGFQISGKPLQFPVIHSQHAWFIQGPEVNARLMFFLGVDGVGYFAQTHLRPRWTGMKDYFATVAQNSEPTAQHGVILRSFELADAAYRRVKREAGKLPNDGYGVVGVCNDPTQYIETQLLAEFGGILMPGVKNPHYSKYPLLRSRTLEVASDLKDPFESIIKAMPFDIPLGVNEAGAVPTEDEVGTRLLRSAPDAWKQSEFWDKRLQRDLLAIFNRLFKK